MKIFYKKQFISGLIFLLLAIVLVLTSVLTGFEMKSTLIAVVLFILGIEEIKRSLSKKYSNEDIIEDTDERNLLIDMKSRSFVYKVLSKAIWGFIIICMIGYTWNKSQLWISALLVVGILWMVLSITRLCSLFYFEKHE